jgi:hypothetical protein
MKKPCAKLEKIISGGQTGVDRAALDIAIELNITHGGWCPKGCKAEDGVIPAKYHLQETPSDRYSERTEWNVRDSDGTLIIIKNLPPTGGTKLTIDKALKLKKPCFILDLSKEPQIDDFIIWITTNHIRTLNVAGSRESQNPGIYNMACVVLRKLLIDY